MEVIQKSFFGKPILIIGCLLAFFCFIKIGAMEVLETGMPYIFEKSNTFVAVKTNDGKVAFFDRWTIDQMKVLLVLLEHQKGKNNANNPIDASMISMQELQLLETALDAASEVRFEEFYNQLAKEDGLGDTLAYSLGEGKLRMLVNAAQKVEATGLSALCLAYFLPSESQYELTSSMASPISFFKNILIKKYAPCSKIFLEGEVKNDVRSVVFSPDDKKIVVRYNFWAGWAGNVSEQEDHRSKDLLVLDVVTGGIVVKLQDHLGTVRSVALSPDGKSIVTGFAVYKGKNIVVWNALTGEKTMEFAGLVDAHCVAFNSDGTKIIAGEGSRHLSKVILFDAVTGQEIVSIDTSDLSTNDIGSVYGVAFSPTDHNKIVAVGERGVLICDISDSNNVKKIAFHNCFGSSVAFSPDGKKIVFGGRPEAEPVRFWSSVVMWNLSTMKTTVLEGHEGIVYSVAFSPDGSLIVSGSEGKAKDEFFTKSGNEHNPIVWDAFTGEQLISLEGQHKVYSVTFNHDGNKIISGGHNPNLIVWTLLTDEQKATLNQINNLNVAQKILVYQLYLASLRRNIIVPEKGSAQYGVFMTLPGNIRELLSDCLSSKGLSWSW